MFGRLGAWAYRRRGVVVLLWLGALVVGGAASGIVGSAYSTEFGLPDVESRRGFDVLEAEMGGVGSGLDGVVVLQHEAGFDDPELRATIDGFLDEIDDLPDTTVQSPFADQTAQTSPALLEWYAGGAAQAGEGAAELLGQGSGTRQISSEGPQAGKIAYATIELPGDTDMDAAHDFADEVRGLAPQVDGLRIELGGSIFQEFEPPAAELIGLAFAILILILAFGSVMAMGLPIGVALAGIGIGSILLGLLSNVVEMPDFATTLGIMIGLGVGIDYALFIVTRFREQLHSGHTVGE